MKEFLILRKRIESGEIEEDRVLMGIDILLELLADQEYIKNGLSDKQLLYQNIHQLILKIYNNLI